MLMLAISGLIKLRQLYSENNPQLKPLKAKVHVLQLLIII